MADVGLAFLSASLSVLFDRMASPEVVDFMQGRKLTVRLSRKLKTAMLSVKAVLADAEEKQLTNPLVKDWVDELKDVLFDAEDILDEIATEALQRKLDAESRTTAEKNGKVGMNIVNSFYFSKTNAQGCEAPIQRPHSPAHVKGTHSQEPSCKKGPVQYSHSMPTLRMGKSV